jgi:hypothetical protein
MQQTKTRQEREKELRLLIATPEGRVELERLASHYQGHGGGTRPGRTSIITWIIVHEREKGLIAP